MKILYITDQVYLHGGIEKVLTIKANYLAELDDYEVSILTYQQHSKRPVYPLSQKIRLVDIAVNYDIQKSYFHPQNIVKLPLHLSRLKKNLKDIRPDVVVSCNYGPDFYFLPWIAGKIPVIKEFHSSRAVLCQTATLKNSLLYRLSRWAEKRYSRIVVLNNDEKPYYNNSSISVIPNPVKDSSNRSFLNHKNILAAGRISPVKNFGDIIIAFSRLHEQFPDWQLHIWGEDYIGTKSLLQNQINDLKLHDKVKFKGVTNDLQTEMHNYSIYAMTSETECFPMVLLESLSNGVPIITYHAPTGPKHIVRDQQDGFIVPYKNLDIFTEKMSLLMSDESLRKSMGRQAIKNVQRFHISKVMKIWQDLFEEITRNHKRSN